MENNFEMRLAQSDQAGEESRKSDGILSGAVDFLRRGRNQLREDRRERLDGGRSSEEDVTIDDVGVIDEYKLPDGFKRSDQGNDAAFDHMEFQSDKSPTMKIAYWNWYKNQDYSLDDATAGSLKEILRGKPDRLTAEERESIQQVFPAGMYGYSTAFDVLDMRVAEIDGKKVLIMENQYISMDPNRPVDRRSYGIFIPSDQNANRVEHLHFEGTQSDFRRHFPKVKRSFNRIDFR